MEPTSNPEKEAQAAVEQALPDQKKPGRKALQIFAVIVLLALVGGGIYVWQNNRVTQQESNVAETKKVVVTNLKPEEVTTKIKNKLASTYTVVEANGNNKLAKNQVGATVQKSSPVYQVNGYGFYTSYDGGSTINIRTNGDSATTADTNLPDADHKAIRLEVAGIYKDLGLAKKTSRDFAADGIGTDVYEGKGLVCTVEQSNAAISGSTASCGSLAEYPHSAAIAKPFAVALGDIETTTILSNVKIKDSLVNGYQHASLSRGDVTAGGGAYVLLYKKAGSNWTYFKTTQEVVPCSDYNTMDLRNAFKGEQCYDTKTNADAKVQ